VAARAAWPRVAEAGCDVRDFAFHFLAHQANAMQSVENRSAPAATHVMINKPPATNARCASLEHTLGLSQMPQHRQYRPVIKLSAFDRYILRDVGNNHRRWENEPRA
jgi:hypothetical protein